jgi:hypothetical protein
MVRRTRNAKENQMTRRREDHREGRTIWRARFIDAISREQVGQATFSADSVEEARQRAWRIAAGGFGTPEGAWVVGGNDIDVRVERASR